MSEAFLALVPIRPGAAPALRQRLEAFDPERVGASPFAAVPGTHVVRLSVIETVGARDAGHRHLTPALLSFSGLVDGSLDAWLLTMATTLGPVGDALWADCSGWPGPGPAVTARWMATFRQRMHTCVIAHDQPTVEEIRLALDRQRKLRELAIRAQTLPPKELRAAYAEIFGPVEEMRG